MKFVKIGWVLLFSFIFLSAFSLKKEKEKEEVYIWGISASFTDTVVYYTGIQLMDSIKLDKHGFLPKRDVYSYQLKNYLENKKNIPNRVCMIYFSKRKKTLEKETEKLLKTYEKNKNTTLQQLEASEFQFTYAGL
jgi:16S rRNA A1518/A1519 N6-dimethyltransferase RsmA/KsgA/DIM1 with predicted DNA glycosylase/AP lyase activity